MAKSYILALDQGTTGSRAFLFDATGKVASSAYKEFRQHYPQPGWVEHDAEEIWSSCLTVIRQAVRRAGIRPDDIRGIGITNQRETTVLWDRATSVPVAPAIVWQCRRTSAICQRPGLKNRENLIRRKTGLVLDPYFSATKILWSMENVKGLRQRAVAGDICFGTIDSWLIYKLTGGQQHVTDMTNASRTLLMDIHDRQWDPELCKIFKVPRAILPEIRPSGSDFGRTARLGASLPEGIPIAAVLGDQQAALYGQGCFRKGDMKNTYGTGCFLVLNTGTEAVVSEEGLLTTIASDEWGRPVYALEGAIFVAGAVVQWLRDELKIIKNSAETESLARECKDNHGVYLVPAFTGLGAPHWDSEARGLICGLTRGSDRKVLVRAALESIAYQTRDVFDVMARSVTGKIKELKVDGGASMNAFLMQFQADMLSCPIVRPKGVETTVQGAAMLAGVTIGLWDPCKDLKKMYTRDKIFRPQMAAAERTRLHAGWLAAVARTGRLV